MKPGDRLGEKYILEKQLARSGMGDIWLAKQLGAIERPVVIKFIHPDLLSQAEARQRFYDEANIVSKLDHPNIVKFYEYDQHDGILYQVMEYIEGYSSAEIIAKSREKGTHIPIPIIARIIADAAYALGYIHQLRGPDGRPLELIHRDISPQNILLSKNGVLKIIDFGIVKAREKSSKTKTGVIVGKLQYMSPEQLSENEIDHRSDIFSLGLVFYEYLTLEPFFKGKTLFEVFYEALNKSIPDVTAFRYDCPPELANILYKTLARTPEERYQDAYQLQNDLESFLYHQGQPVNQLNVAQFLAQLFDQPVENYALHPHPAESQTYAQNFSADTEKFQDPGGVDEHSLSTFFDEVEDEEEFLTDNEPTAVTANPTQFNWNGADYSSQHFGGNTELPGDGGKTVISSYPLPQTSDSSGPTDSLGYNPSAGFSRGREGAPPGESSDLAKVSEEAELEHTLSSHNLNGGDNYGADFGQNGGFSPPYSPGSDGASHTLQHPSPRASQARGRDTAVQRPSPVIPYSRDKRESDGPTSSSNVIVSPELFSPPKESQPASETVVLPEKAVKSRERELGGPGPHVQGSSETVVLSEEAIKSRRKEPAAPPQGSSETVVLSEELLRSKSDDSPPETVVLNKELLSPESERDRKVRDKKSPTSEKSFPAGDSKSPRKRRGAESSGGKGDKNSLVRYSIFVSIGILLGVLAFFLIYLLFFG